MMNASITNWAAMTPEIPILVIKTPRTAPPKIIPTLFAANISPLTLATSSGCSTSTARASVATSCRDEKMLWMKSILATRSICPFKSLTRSRDPRVIAMPVWAKSIHCLRGPYFSMYTESTRGPQIHLNVHGRETVANRIAISGTDTPLATR